MPFITFLRGVSRLPARPMRSDSPLAPTPFSRQASGLIERLPPANPSLSRPVRIGLRCASFLVCCLAQTITGQLCLTNPVVPSRRAFSLRSVAYSAWLKRASTDRESLNHPARALPSRRSLSRSELSPSAWPDRTTTDRKSITHAAGALPFRRALYRSAVSRSAWFKRTATARSLLTRGYPAQPSRYRILFREIKYQPSFKRYSRNRNCSLLLLIIKYSFQLHRHWHGLKEALHSLTNRRFGSMSN